MNNIKSEFDEGGKTRNERCVSLTIPEQNTQLSMGSSKLVGLPRASQHPQ